MAQIERNGRRADPVSAWAGGMRRFVNLDLGEITRGLASLANPGGGFLDMLGRTREERVEKMATMLRNGSEADMEEMGHIFALAAAKVAEDNAGGGNEQDRARRRAERPRRSREMTSAEWRKARRRAS